MTIHRGGCHCGRVRFEVDAPAILEVHPDGYSVNARCLDPGSVEDQIVRPFDGRNWEAHVHELER